MKKLILMLSLVALPLAAAQTEAPSLYPSYESTRQALLGTNVDKVKAAAIELSKVATEAKETTLAKKADALASAKTMSEARDAFGALSDDMVTYRKAHKSDSTLVAWCPMARKSWVQPTGELSNPYVSAGMRKCGEVKKDVEPAAGTK